MPSWFSSNPALTLVCRGNQLGLAQRQKALNPDAARLSDGALVQLKNHKLAHCVAQLTDMGLDLHAAQDAAKLMGGDVENASHWHMDSTRSPPYSLISALTVRLLFCCLCVLWKHF